MSLFMTDMLVTLRPFSLESSSEGMIVGTSGTMGLFCLTAYTR